MVRRPRRRISSTIGLVHGAGRAPWRGRRRSRAPASSCPCRPCSVPRRPRRCACSPARARAGSRARRRRARAARAPRRRGTPRARPRSRRSAGRRRTSSSARAGLVLGLADDHALARREHVGLQHDGVVAGARYASASSASGTRRARGRDADLLHQLLRERLRALEPRGGRASGRSRVIPGSRERVETPATSGASGPTTTRSQLSSRGSRDDRVDVLAETSTHLIRSPAMPAFPARR